MALGNAYVARDAQAIFYHPALLATDGVGASAQRFGEGSTHVTIAGGMEWFDGAVGIGASFLEYGANGQTPSGLLRDVGALGLNGPFAASEFMASAGYAREVVDGLRAGAVAKVIGQRLAGAHGSTAAVDLGLGMEAGPVTLALSAQNLGPELEIGSEALPLAKRVTFGASTRRTPVGPLDIGLAGQVTRDGAGDILPGGGVEVAWWPVIGRVFVARIGVQRVVDGVQSALTFGGGFEGDRIRIDYAFQGFDSLEGAHRFGLAFR